MLGETNDVNKDDEYGFSENRYFLGKRLNVEVDKISQIPQ